MHEQSKARIEKLESYLNQTCDAEASGDRAEAERQFRRAVFYEAKLRSDVVHAKDYVAMVGPVYPTVSGEDKSVAQQPGSNAKAAAPCKS